MRLLATLFVLANAGLLSATNESKIESWLGQGNLDFTNVFTKTSGSDSYAFHAAVDGLGPTITLMRLSHVEGNPNDRAVGQILGGYNPQSWNSSNSYNITANNADRTGFIFNLSTDTKFDQRLSGTSSDPFENGFGRYQTFNWGGRGPAFGGGHDLTLGNDLTHGYTRQFSYGVAGSGSLAASRFGENLLGDSLYNSTRTMATGGLTDFSVDEFEVFTFAPASPPTGAGTVPEPASVALFGLLGLGTIARRRR